MRRAQTLLATTSMIGCLLIAGAPASAQQASPGTDDVRRVAAPEAGIAVTFPEYWLVSVLMEPLEVKIGTDPETTVSGWHVLQAMKPENFPAPGRQACDMVVAQVDDPTSDFPILPSADRFGPWPSAGMPPFDSIGVPTDADLPVGHAQKFEIGWHEPDGDWTGTVYRFAAADSIGWLMCAGFEEPADDAWASIAETLVLAPMASRSAPGFEIAFPDGWIAREPTTADVVWTQLRLPPESRHLVRTKVVAEAPNQMASCRVVDETLLLAERPESDFLDRAIVADIVTAQADTNQTVIDSVVLELPSGRVGRIDLLLLKNAAMTNRYHFADEAASYYLECSGLVVPDDLWLSIAETFEFLPAEG